LSPATRSIPTCFGRSGEQPWGFFGVITQYRLKTRPAPRAITACNHFYPLARMDAVGVWAASIAGKMPKEVELTLFCTAGGGLGGAEAVSAGSELLLKVGERDLPESPFGPAIRCHRQPPFVV
jgi:FAD/FMN-containing dehydrogenase